MTMLSQKSSSSISVACCYSSVIAVVFVGHPVEIYTVSEKKLLCVRKKMLCVCKPYLWHFLFNFDDLGL